MSEDLKIKAELEMKHKLATLKSEILKKIRSEMDETDLNVSFLKVAETYQKHMLSLLKVEEETSELVSATDVTKIEESTKEIGNSTIKSKKSRRKSILGLADSGSTESVQNKNLAIKSFIAPESNETAITDSMSFFNK